MANNSNFMTLMGATALNNARTTNNIIHNTPNVSKISKKTPIDNRSVGNQGDQNPTGVNYGVSSHYEGEVWYDPASLKCFKWMQDDVGNWYAVPSEDYENCRSGVMSASACAIVGGYSSAVGAPSAAYGYSSCVTGTTHAYSSGYGANFSPRSMPDVSYTNDLDIYYRHLYREELKKLGLKGVGFNKFGLRPSVNREDTEICEKIVDKFKNDTMATTFEKRLHDALKKKKELEEKIEIRKSALKARMAENRTERMKVVDEKKRKFEEKLKTIRQKESRSFMDSVEDAIGGVGEQLDNLGDSLDGLGDELEDKFNRMKNRYNTRTTTSPPTNNLYGAGAPKETPKETKEKTDKEIINYYIAAKLHQLNYKMGKEVDGLQYFDFTFDPPYAEDDPALDAFEELKPRVVKSKEMTANAAIRSLQDDDYIKINNALGTVMGKFAKKKTFIQVLRVNHDTILEKAKEYYG